MIAPSEEPRGPEPVRLIVIYSNPKDFPGKFVVRDHYAFKGFVKVDKFPRCVVDTLAEARSSIPEGLVCLNRNDEDDSVIVETWI